MAKGTECLKRYGRSSLAESTSAQRIQTLDRRRSGRLLLEGSSWNRLLMVKGMLRNLARSRGYEITRIPADGYRRNGRVQQSGHLTAFETEEWFHNLYEQAQAKTQMQGSDNQLRRQRHYTLNHLLRTVLTQADGDVCEVGCWRGLSAYQLAQRIKDSGNQVTLHVFDSFQGLSEYRPEDVPRGRSWTSIRFGRWLLVHSLWSKTT